MVRHRLCDLGPDFKFLTKESRSSTVTRPLTPPPPPPAWISTEEEIINDLCLRGIETPSDKWATYMSIVEVLESLYGDDVPKPTELLLIKQQLAGLSPIQPHISTKWYDESFDNINVHLLELVGSQLGLKVAKLQTPEQMDTHYTQPQIAAGAGEGPTFQEISDIMLKLCNPNQTESLERQQPQPNNKSRPWASEHLEP